MSDEKLLTVEEAQAASAAADCRVRQLSNELDEAKRLADEARKELEAARVRADAHLPRATEVTTSRYRRDGPHRKTVVVVRKTATQATVRDAGCTRERKYRLNVKKWEPSPRRKRSWDTPWTTLEFPEASDE